MDISVMSKGEELVFKLMDFHKMEKNSPKALITMYHIQKRMFPIGVERTDSAISMMYQYIKSEILKLDHEIPAYDGLPVWITHINPYDFFYDEENSTILIVTQSRSYTIS